MAKAAAPAKPSSSGKKTKKKWSKGKVKDKAVHAVLFEQNTLDKLMKEVGTYKMITVSTLVDRLKINGSLARAALTDLEKEGKIRCVCDHSKQKIYTRVVVAEE